MNNVPFNNFEVERKFQIQASEYLSIQERLKILGFEKFNSTSMTDTFLPTHYPYDLIRLRHEKCLQSDRYLLTCKSWFNLKNGTRERIEEEEVINAKLAQILLNLANLAKAPTLSYTKHRLTYYRTLSKQTVTVCLDKVLELGKFNGHYLEIEILAKSELHASNAQAKIDKLVISLLGKSSNPVYMSYLDMLKQSQLDG